MNQLPELVRRERLVNFVVVITGLFAEQAQIRELDLIPRLDQTQFSVHCVDVLEGLLAAPSNVPLRPEQRASHRLLGSR